MPTTRRSSGRTATGPGKQSTLSFSSRVTKNVPKATAKDIIAADPSKATATKDEVDVIEPTDAIPAPPAAAAADVKVPAAEKAEEAEVAAEEEQDQAEESEPEVEEPEVVVRPEAAAEKRAELVSDAQVGRYWRAIEAQRTAKRVHQQDLAVGEKVLRYFDVSSHYGPCVGLTRTKRWHRAQRLGLNPPIEVLAVLLKEEAKGKKGVEVAEMDVILNHTAVGSHE